MPYRVLVAAAGVAVSTILLAFAVVNVYAAALSLLSGGEVDVAGLRRFAAAFGLWGVPAIFALLVAGASAWVARGAGWYGGWLGGCATGLLAAAGAQLLGLALGPLVLREVAVYAILGVVCGVGGTAAARASMHERRALYAAGRGVAAAETTDEVATAVGEHLAARRGDRVAVLLATGGGALRPVGTWAPTGEGAWSVDPAALLEGRDGWRLVRSRSRQRAGALLVFRAGTGGSRTAMVVELRGLRARWGPLGRRVAPYLSVGPQVALALENLRLLEEARRAGVLEERQRLAFEIHDTLVQDLSGIVMNLETAEDLTEEGGPSLPYLDRARRVARAGLVEARRLVLALRPEALERSSLPETLERLAGEWSAENGTRASFSVTGTARPLSLATEATLLRAAQEALQNVRKHAAAGNAMLTLSFMGDRVALDVRDDGRGFDPASPPGGPGGFGLVGMRERAAQLGGVVTVESEHGAGTTVSVELPAEERR